mgnify:FL=1
MPLNMLFGKPRNKLEKGGRKYISETEEGEVTQKCPVCGKETPISTLWKHLNVCQCGYCFKMNPRQRIDFIADKGTFAELDANLIAQDILQFPGYAEKIENIRKSSREKEAVICGEAEISGEKCALFVMDPFFMMGSMGIAVGEKITRLFEHATEKGLPVVGFTVSGGARMQEGLMSLMQMAKTSGAVKKHSDAGHFYLTVLTNPTTGGVTASFAMEGDIILSEPGAVVGFAGARVIEQTVRKKLPNGFQRAEFVLRHGFIDKIVERDRQKEMISRLLRYHRGDIAHGKHSV